MREYSAAMTRALAFLLTLGYLLLVPFCFFGGMAMANVAMPEMDGMSTHAHALTGCAAGPAIGCAHLADPHAPGGGHGDMYLSLTETPFQSGILLIVFLAIVFTILRVDLAALTIAAVRRVIQTTALCAPRAYTRRDLFARLALFEASPNGI